MSKGIDPGPPPTPKYKLGEAILFNRQGTEYARSEDEGDCLDYISRVECSVRDHRITDSDREIAAGEWTVMYMGRHHEYEIPEYCVLGPVTVGPRR